MPRARLRIFGMLACAQVVDGATNFELGRVDVVDQLVALEAEIVDGFQWRRNAGRPAPARSVPLASESIRNGRPI